MTNNIQKDAGALKLTIFKILTTISKTPCSFNRENKQKSALLDVLKSF